ncbi:MAG: Maf family protein [Acidobacteriia bacterium]|nr:Maf family protein [Terriglobia bacterium]
MEWLICFISKSNSLKLKRDFTAEERNCKTALSYAHFQFFQVKSEGGIRADQKPALDGGNRIDLSIQCSAINIPMKNFKFPRYIRKISWPYGLVLASGSPRRKQILRTAEVRFRCVASRVPEKQPRKRERRTAYAARLAAVKAQAVERSIQTSEVIVAADTVVCLDGKVFGKPTSPASARAMLHQLAGKWHRVITGVALIDPLLKIRKKWSVTTFVKFRRLLNKEIDHYVSTSAPFDKAGAYAIQGAAGDFVEAIKGSFFNVMGLPIESLRKELEQLAGLRKSYLSRRGNRGKARVRRTS